MSAKCTSGTIFIREHTLLPAGLAIEADAYLPGWKTVRNLDGYGLGRKIEDAKWNFFYLAGDISSIALGREGPGSLRKAVKRILVKQGGEKFNSLEITQVVSKWFLVIPYRRITAHFRHIQPGVGLVDSANDSLWRISSSPSRETATQRRAALITGS
jgi:hypothetical protein